MRSEPEHPALASKFARRLGFLSNPHVQTLLGAIVRPQVAPFVRRERLELPDGDFVDVDHGPEPVDERAPIVVILHGLEGSSASGYVRLVAHHLLVRGASVVALNFRSCSGVPNRLPRLYHSGETADLSSLLAHLRRESPGRSLRAVGFSLGGNVLLKYLGERGDAALLDRAVAVSVPFELAACSTSLSRGFARVYSHHLLSSLHGKLRARAAELAPFCDPAAGLRARTFRDFDDAVTAPLHGFSSADDYFARSSSRPFVAHIRRPTLVLQAEDDPFVPAHAIPWAEAEASGQVRLDVSPHGGHVGFIAPSFGSRRHGPRTSSFAVEPHAARFLVPEAAPRPERVSG
ncbi:MAG: alpha/beta fold hydrolase [Myxococcales bacterium]|nr:alpha/beta fold hydrolase [Myxococcales bacterium]